MYIILQRINYDIFTRAIVYELFKLLKIGTNDLKLDVPDSLLTNKYLYNFLNDCY